MGELVLLVVAAAWAAVLIPPLLRSRIENRPNSSVTDFRRQLNRLQSTVPNRAAAPMRGGMARPLAQSPLHRPAAAGRPGMQTATLRKGGTRAHGDKTGAPAPQARTQTREAAPRRRTHGDPTGGQPRPPQARRANGVRQEQPVRHATSSADQVRRRRSNVLFMFVITAGSTLFLAATTKEPAMLYVFGVAFLGLCGYMYMLAQARQREAGSWPADWMQH